MLDLSERRTHIDRPAAESSTHHLPPRPNATAPGFARVLPALLLFGISFGYVEAAVVVYLRPLYRPLHERFTGQSESELFPLIRLEQLEAAGPEPRRWLVTELIREGATLVLLASVGLAVAHNFRQWFAAFAVAFGLWDIFYYIFLKLMLDWPESIFTWDLLFLLPVPWAGPVLAPGLVALSMIGAGVYLLARESAGRPLRLQWSHWTVLVAGGIILIVAFCWDYRNLLAGGEPNPFNWPLFVAGEMLGLAAFAHAAAKSVRVATM